MRHKWKIPMMEEGRKRLFSVQQQQQQQMNISAGSASAMSGTKFQLDLVALFFFPTDIILKNWPSNSRVAPTLHYFFLIAMRFLLVKALPVEEQLTGRRRQNRAASAANK